MIFASTSSYVDVAEAETYFAVRMNSDAWDAEDDDLKTKCLIQATRTIDTLWFAGDKSVSTQELEFPRNGETLVPAEVKIACCELAIDLLEGVDMAKEIRNLNVIKAEYSVVRSTYDRSFAMEHLICGISSYVAWQQLRRFLGDNRQIKISRDS